MAVEAPLPDYQHLCCLQAANLNWMLKGKQVEELIAKNLRTAPPTPTGPVSDRSTAATRQHRR